MEKYSVAIMGLLLAVLFFLISASAWAFMAIGIATITGWSYWVVIPVMFVASFVYALLVSGLLGVND